MRKKGLPSEALDSLRVRLSELDARSKEKRDLIKRTAEFYGVSRATVYRGLELQPKPKSLRRTDHGKSRKLAMPDLIEYCKIVAALKVRTQNKKGRHMSTKKAVEILEEHGVEVPKGFVKTPPGLLTPSLVNRYLSLLGFDHPSMWCEPPSVRFQAEHSNECWQFDLSPSDLKEIEEPSWIDRDRGKPTLMLFSVVDDRSGAAYQEYRCVYGEDVESALRFLFNAMSPKSVEGFHLQGIPGMIYLDNGPVEKSLVFKRVMERLKIKVQPHQPRNKDGRRTTSRSKGKVERPFRTIKEAHEVLYHFHKPKTEEEANAWLMRYLLHYNQRDHRSEEHSRIEDWLRNLPEGGYQSMCSWERFCSFARSPETADVDKDARISVDGVEYEVDPNLASEKKVILWWGLFDNELYVEHNERQYGPYRPVNGPIPLNRYRKFKKTRRERRADEIHELAAQIKLPRSVVTGLPEELPAADKTPTPHISFPDPGEEVPDYPNASTAKLAIAHYLGRPIPSLPSDARTFVAELAARTLNKREINEQVKAYFAKLRQREDHRAH